MNNKKKSSLDPKLFISLFCVFLYTSSLHCIDIMLHRDIVVGNKDAFPAIQVATLGCTGWKHMQATLFWLVAGRRCWQVLVTLHAHDATLLVHHDSLLYYDVIISLAHTHHYMKYFPLRHFIIKIIGFSILNNSINTFFFIKLFTSRLYYKLKIHDS